MDLLTTVLVFLCLGLQSGFLIGSCGSKQNAWEFAAWDDKLMGKRPQHSASICLYAVTAGRVEAQGMRFCHLKNICFEKEVGFKDALRPIYYSLDPYLKPAQLEMRLDVPTLFEKSLRHPWLMMKPRVVHGHAIPEEGTCYPKNDVGNTAIYTPWRDGRIGYSFYDALFSLYSAIDAFDQNSQPLSLLFLGRNRMGCPTNSTEQEACKRIEMVISSLLGSSQPLVLEDQVEKALATPGCQRMCLNSSLVGFGAQSAFCPKRLDPLSLKRPHGPHPCMNGKGGVLRRLREHTRKALGLPLTIDHQPLLRKTPINKDNTQAGCKLYLPFFCPTTSPATSELGEDWGRHVDRFIRRAKATLESPANSHHQVCLERVGMELEKASPKEQVEFISKVAIQVGACAGSTLFTSLYLPEGSHLLLFCGPKHREGIHIYRAMPHLTRFHAVSPGVAGALGNEGVDRMADHVENSVNMLLNTP